MTQRIKPILFSGPMIRALLDGRKTQTRRIAKFVLLQAGWNAHFSAVTAHYYGDGGFTLGSPGAGGCWNDRTKMLQTYAPGDLLWVRETMRLSHVGGGRGGGIAPFNAYELHRRATDDYEYFEVVGEDDPHLRFAGDNWRPSIFMPRWASRLTLEVTAVKVERLQEISEADAIAEGVDAVSVADVPRPAAWSHRQDYSRLWNHINGASAWDKNPWVVAVSFRVHTANVDAVLKQREAA